ncbi:AAA family ATPase [Colwellia psychrerythraea]|uniref:Putative chromosomal cassette SCCmec type IVc protein n=1 Tax=Colwellia psychrerythraea TaxID=28229 RepID=A0A099K996_COLPS|nr:AAA family ATPase [Colwellia psychrerythraea]KGJ87324.1 putative chromosomal cassette SCCmec type IVc protein [Colwellia psychrerythraea]
MDIQINNCNNITSANVAISPNKLNIKFAPNGTGKSTISKAIQFASSNDEVALANLLPFKLRENNPDNIQPEVVGIEQEYDTLCFNEEYVSKFTFQPDELVNNSFDIFIRTEFYQEKEAEIQEFIKAVREQFVNAPDLENLLTHLKELSGAFKVTAAGGLAKTSTGAKALAGANKIDHIPAGLESYQPFIQSDKSVTWVDWQSKGHSDFSHLSDSCPFCTNDATDQKTQIAKVGEEYDKNLIKNLVKIVTVINELGDYFSETALIDLNVIKSLENGLEREHETFLVTVKSQIDDLVLKLEKLKSLTGFDFEEGENVREKLDAYKIDLQFFDKLNSDKTNESINTINQSVDVLMQQAGPLQGKINQQRGEMRRLIEKHQNDINDFLTFAGYRYQVQIVGEGEQSQLKLRHLEHSNHLSGGSQHLSFGERNAFSIVLFMYECIAKSPNLIILDDPISSFDKNKKFAILQMLFRREARECLKGRTVLMLTHDVEPIIDTLRSVRGQFSNQVSAAYLKLLNGEITEQSISSEDIKTFIQICEQVFQSDLDPIIKLIYLRRRYEVLGELGNAYQTLSNIFKKREEAIDHRIPLDDGGVALMQLDALNSGIAEICGFIPELSDNYSSIVAIFSDDERVRGLYQASINGYEKLQLTRILLDIEVIGNSVIRKFINETYHIENEFIFQLNPTQFDLIPEYVVDECDKILADVMP